MPAGTMREMRETALEIFRHCDNFQVRRIDAPRITTEVVQLEGVRNRAMDQLVAIAMGIDLTLAIEKLAVASLAVTCTKPNPAIAGLQHKIPESALANVNRGCFPCGRVRVR